MNELITKNIDAIKTLCKQYHVIELYVFGSVVREDFNEQSDVDFLVRYRSQPDVMEQFNNYLILKSKLEGLLKKPVDLIEMEMIDNKYLRYFINQEKKELYAEA